MEGIELIDFHRPDSVKKCLFISNLRKNDSPATSEVSDELTYFKIQKQLEAYFNKYGLIYNINVVDACHPGNSSAGTGECAYGFVRYYSEKDAVVAKKDLIGRLFINGKLSRIKHSCRELSAEPPVLYPVKCYELANHFLGFNGWAIKIMALSEETLYEGQNSNTVCYQCVVQLDIVKHDLHTVAVGTAKQTYVPTDVASKGVAICKAKKNAYLDATRNAFKKVILVRLSDDRIHVEINTTVEETYLHNEDLNTTELIKVNELEESPEVDSDEESNPSQVDDINKLILQELAEENF